MGWQCFLPVSQEPASAAIAESIDNRGGLMTSEYSVPNAGSALHTAGYIHCHFAAH